MLTSWFWAWVKALIYPLLWVSGWAKVEPWTGV